MDNGFAHSDRDPGALRFVALDHLPQHILQPLQLPGSDKVTHIREQFQRDSTSALLDSLDVDLRPLDVIIRVGAAPGNVNWRSVKIVGVSGGDRRPILRLANDRAREREDAPEASRVAEDVRERERASLAEADEDDAGGGNWKLANGFVKEIQGRGEIGLLGGQRGIPAVRDPE